MLRTAIGSFEEVSHSMNEKQGFPLTIEQQAVLALCKATAPPQGELIRVTSGAGTGKTTTLQHLATKLNSLGHRKVCYVT